MSFSFKFQEYEHNDRLLSKHVLSEDFTGDSKCKTEACCNVCEDSSLESTSKIPYKTELQKKSNKTPRIGTITTPHGIIETPAFIFCATKGAIKGLTMEDMISCNTQIVLGNTYHLMLSPGENVIERLGGISKMSGWNGPTLTDSGGYQIFSMGYGSVAEEIKGNRKFYNAKSIVKISEDGALFKSYINGENIFLTPEKSIEIQKKIGADLIVSFDECTPYHVNKDYTAKSMERSHRWEKRSLNKFLELESLKTFEKPQALYGIVQGGVYEDLRIQSCEFVNSEDFFGQAIGGSLGATKEEMQNVVEFTMKNLRKDKPIHLLGIGKIEDIFHGVEIGIDTFDCVHPTRIARHGGALVKRNERQKLQGNINREHINLRNNMFVGDNNPIEEDCLCPTCKKYSRGYINLLLKNQEMVAHMLIARHNVYFMNKLMEEIRSGIIAGNLDEIKNKWC